MIKLLPTRKEILESLKILGMAVLGGTLLAPLVRLLPLLGWDWYIFFNANHPVNNIYNPANPFFPYTRYIIQLFTWLPWRDSLAWLGGISMVSVALGVWKAGGRYLQIVLALFTPTLFMLLWIGHPDGLALLGVITGIVPLALIKPQVAVWSFFRNKGFAFWTGIFLALVFLIWPEWLTRVSAVSWDHSGSFGWHVTGWPMALLGVFLLLGSGNNFTRLMAAGCLLSPDLMPYHLVVLLPLFGIYKGWRLGLLWFTAWLLVIGVGLGGDWRYLNLAFPLAGYWLSLTPAGYLANLRQLLKELQSLPVAIRDTFKAILTGKGIQSGT